jgi:hypothetical protein
VSVEFVVHDDCQLAIIVRAGGGAPGTRFITGPDAPLQLGEIVRAAGHRIPAHAHGPRSSTITETHEFLHLVTGTLKVELYGSKDVPVETRMLHAGDTILLTSGAHGFEFVTACHIIAVKQGPHLGQDDKIHV